MTEFVSITDQHHPKAQAHQSPEEPDDNSLPEKYPDDLGDVRADRFHDPDVARLLDGDRNQCVHDPERRDDDDEEEQEKHDGALEPDGLEELLVHVDPGLGVLRRLEELLDLPFDRFGGIRIDSLDRDAVKRIPQPVEFLSNKNRDEQKLRVVKIMAGLEDTGYG